MCNLGRNLGSLPKHVEMVLGKAQLDLNLVSDVKGKNKGFLSTYVIRGSLGKMWTQY